MSRVELIDPKAALVGIGLIGEGRADFLGIAGGSTFHDGPEDEPDWSTHYFLWTQLMVVLLNSNFAKINGVPLWALVMQAALGVYSAGCECSGWVEAAGYCCSSYRADEEKD